MLSASPKVMPSKSYVDLELKSPGSEVIPWEYVSAARLRTVVEDDDCIGVMGSSDFFFLCDLAQTWLQFFIFQRNSKRFKQVRRVAVSPDLRYLYLFCVLYATDAVSSLSAGMNQSAD